MAEIIVVDDASTDASAGVLRILAACGRIRLLRHDVNRGCARATATGLAAAGGAIVVTFDADCSYAPAYIGLLADALRERRAAIALASPYARGGRVSNVPPVRALASACANRLLCALSGNAASTFTGLVRAYDGAALRRLQFENVEGEFNATLLVRALRAGEPVVEVPAHLCWPAARRRAAGRMSARMLGRRTGFVLRTAWTLARSPRAR